ncbi:MAG: hypothetical protein CVU92_01705 [Firmicutes bacterium HGW-Firmicutes-17]|nr:MAG: hypothetical protein CVU92_01705 [Firmicutes bacterium HGW-Firmicutes-17]
MGSYIGGVIGGLGTLIAVYITTIETRKIQQHTQEEIDENKAMSAKKERKIFSDEIAKVISKYLSDIKICFQANQIIYKKYARLRHLKNELSFSELSFHRIDCQKEIDSLLIDIKHTQENQPVPAENLNLLRIYLHNIDEAQDLLEKLKNASTLSEIEDTKESDFLYAIDDLVKLTTIFCYKYVNEKNN